LPASVSLTPSVESILGSHGFDKYHAMYSSETIHIRTLYNLHRANIIDAYHIQIRHLHAIAEDKYRRGAVYGVLCA
jgi:hypothetical protein